MSKSIYEEVLEKIDVEFDAWDRAEHLELFELVEQALEQAQKQEKLLELYKELAMFLTTAVEDGEDTHAYIFANINNLKEQIKEKENESNR